MISIDGVQYPNICPTDIYRVGTFEDKFLERTMDGTMQRELVGVYFSYQITCGYQGNTAEYYAFWDDIHKSIDFRIVRVPHNAGYLEFQAYFSDTNDHIILRKEDLNIYADFTITFLSRSPNTTPY